MQKAFGRFSIEPVYGLYGIRKARGFDVYDLPVKDSSCLCKGVKSMNKKYIVQARVFKAMSDENRLKILELLHEKDYNASELLEEMNFGQSTLSHHMRILLSAGIIQSRKNGKWTYYSLQKDAYEDMIAWMQQYL